MTTVAVVEDEPKLASLLNDYLIKEGFETVLYSDGTLALESLLASPADFVLLDLMLPGTDGMVICKELRKESNVPIIMLTAKVDEIDRLLGLEIGADDYICKPFSPREVIARIKAVMRRLSDNASQINPENQKHFELNENAASLRIGDQECSLTSVELNLLKTLHASPGRIFNRSQLMTRIYSDNRVVSDRTIDSHVKKLRQKIETLDTQTQYIHSVYGIGYKFESVNNLDDFNTD